MSVDYSNDPEYAQAKLADSMVTLGEILVNILRVADDGEVLYQPVGVTDRRHTTLKELNLTPIRLGYMNFRMGCSYLSRIPARHYRQGLRGSVLQMRTDIRGFSLVHAKELANTASGIYPTISDCYEEIICGEAVARAFSRDFAISNGKGKLMNLLFKSTVVGTCSWGDRGPQLTLADRFRYLDELMMESLDDRKNL